MDLARGFVAALLFGVVLFAHADVRAEFVCAQQQACSYYVRVHANGGLLNRSLSGEAEIGTYGYESGRLQQTSVEEAADTGVVDGLAGIATESTAALGALSATAGLIAAPFLPGSGGYWGEAYCTVVLEWADTITIGPAEATEDPIRLRALLSLVSSATTVTGSAPCSSYETLPANCSLAAISASMELSGELGTLRLEATDFPGAASTDAYDEGILEARGGEVLTAVATLELAVDAVGQFNAVISVANAPVAIFGLDSLDAQTGYSTASGVSYALPDAAPVCGCSAVFATLWALGRRRGRSSRTSQTGRRRP